jgi:hypothetical protein
MTEVNRQNYVFLMSLKRDKAKVDRNQLTS